MANNPSTHEVLNQPPPLAHHNLYASDTILTETVRREGGDWALSALQKMGEYAGSAEAIQLGFKANENPPVLKTHDRFGHRIDEVEFHPAWHALMQKSVEEGLHNLPWTEIQKNSQVARAGLYFLMSQVDAGHLCPITMTHAVVSSLRSSPHIAREWEPKILSRKYDPEFKPASQKAGVIFGMGMTEKQGGSDVRANTTKAQPINGTSGEYSLTGHKWFCSAPMSDAFLVLAQAPKGLSCFLLPRFKPDGTLNRFLIQRLKNKLGNKSNASSEVEFLDTWAQLVGEEGRGVATIIKMVNATRLDCVIGSTALMRQALSQALHHATYRRAFGNTLANQPLMQNVLADLSLETEAAMMLMMRLARADDNSRSNETENRFKRVATAIAKYWICKRAEAMIYESMECLGGAGYVEESILPRLFREAPVNSIWEGSGNVNCLDMLRALKQDPEALEILFNEIDQAKGGSRHLDVWASKLKEQTRATPPTESQARRFIEALVLSLQGSLLVRHSPAIVSETFCASRLGGDWGNCYGTLPDTNYAAITERARLKVE